MNHFFWCEYNRVLRSRPALLSMLAMAYALLSFPVIVAKPPPEIRAGLEAWFGTEGFGLRLVLFAWFDLVMNKIAVFSAAILAAGIITDERSKQMLDIFLSKPVTMRRYFAIKTLGATAALATLYVILTMFASLYFTFALTDFSLAPFLRMSCVHLFAAMFAAFFAALMAVSFQHKLSAMLATIFVLSMCVGLAFGAFYQPAWASFFLLNPISHGVSLVSTAEHASFFDVIRPIGALLVFCSLAFGVGLLRAGRLEATT